VTTENKTVKLYCPECGREREHLWKCAHCGSTLPARKIWPATAAKVRARYDAHMEALERGNRERAEFIKEYGLDAWNRKLDAELAQLYTVEKQKKGEHDNVQKGS